MLFEVHVTVASDDINRWVNTCHQIGVKPLLIQLSSGDYALQLMSAANHRGTAESAKDFVEGLTDVIRLAGFDILRVKLECPLSGIGDDDQAEYMECHIKLLTDRDSESVVLEAAEDDLYISRSLLGVPETMCKWYLTNRVFDMPAPAAEELFQAAFQRVERLLPVSKIETEAVLLDTNQRVDSGWIPQH